MTMLLQSMLLEARNDDTAGLMKILIVIIFFAISIISNVVKSRAKKTSTGQGGPPSTSSGRAPTQPRQDANDSPLMPAQKPGRDFRGNGQ